MLRLSLLNFVNSILLRFYIRLTGYDIKQITTEEEILKVITFRKKVFSEDIGEIWQSETVTPDVYDPHSIHIVARWGDEIVGIMRLIDLTKTSLIEDVAKLELPASVERNQTLEFSGLAISKKHRGRGKVAFVGMMDLAYRISLSAGKTHWICSFHKKLLKAFQAFNPGFQSIQADLQVQPQLPEYVRKRIVPRWESYNVLLFELRGVSYFQNLLKMVRGSAKIRGGVQSEKNFLKQNQGR